MRLTRLFSWLLLCGTLAFFATTAHAQASRIPGRIVAAKVTGSVTAIDLANQTQRTLAANDTVSQQTRVITGAGSSVVLVFSNGASLNLGAESSMDIEEFLQDPFASEVSVANLSEEPTSSTTRLNLTRGELVGNVKKLNQAAGSTFTVNTPVGAAGIRGTTFRIVFRPDASGRVFFTLSTAEGVVLFEAPAAEGISVETGKEVAVEVQATVDAETGTVTVTETPTITTTTDIPAETQAAIASAAQEIVEASAAVIISTSSSTTTTTSDSSKTEEPTEENKSEPKSEEGEGEQQPSGTPPDPVFRPTTPPPDTTPGAGKIK